MKHMLYTAIILILSTASIVGQKLPEKENDTVIIWTKKRKLTWNDFQKSVHKETKGAQSDIGIDVLSVPTEKNQYTYVVLTYFNKLSSSAATTNPKVLKHEQLHFDIAELFARKMRVKIAQLEKEEFNLEKYNNSLGDIYQNYFSFQEEFDEETGHSRLIEHQYLWEEKIERALRDPESFHSKFYYE
jgi:hypothetical protein